MNKNIKNKVNKAARYYIKLANNCLFLSGFYCKMTPRQAKKLNYTKACIVATTLSQANSYCYTWDECMQICRKTIDENLDIAASHDVWIKKYNDFNCQFEILEYNQPDYTAEMWSWSFPQTARIRGMGCGVTILDAETPLYKRPFENKEIKDDKLGDLISGVSEACERSGGGNLDFV